MSEARTKDAAKALLIELDLTPEYEDRLAMVANVMRATISHAGWFGFWAGCASAIFVMTICRFLILLANYLHLPIG